MNAPACPGELILTQLLAPGHEPRIRIDRADARIWIGQELLDQLRTGPRSPDVHLDDDLLHIDGTNRSVTYLIGPKVEHPTAHIVEAQRLELR